MTPETLLVIRSNIERDDATNEPLFWSNYFGWAYLEDAELFEKPPVTLPTGEGVRMACLNSAIREVSEYRPQSR